MNQPRSQREGEKKGRREERKEGKKEKTKRRQARREKGRKDTKEKRRKKNGRKKRKEWKGDKMKKGGNIIYDTLYKHLEGPVSACVEFLHSFILRIQYLRTALTGHQSDHNRDHLASQFII